MPLWIINLIIGFLLKCGEVEHQGDAIGYRWGNWTFIDNMDPCYVHLLYKDKELYSE